MLHRISPLLLLLLTLPTPRGFAAPGGDPVPTFNMQLKESIDLVSGAGAEGSGVGSITWADTSGLLLGAAFYLVDEALYYTPTPYINGGSIPMGGSSFAGLKDLVTIMNANFEGNDLLIASTDQGLLRIDQYMDLAGIFVPTALTGSSGWSGARHMRVAPRVAEGPDAIWGLRYDDANGSTTVTVLVGELDGTAVQTTELATFPSALKIFDLAITDYDGDGSMDFAVSTNFGLAVYSQDLGQGPELLRRHIVQANSGGCTSFSNIEFVEDNLQAIERLAYWYEVPGDPVGKLAIINGLSTEPIGNIPLFGGDPTVGTLPSTISVGDINGDGNDDLFLTMRGQSYGLMLSNLADLNDPAPTNRFGFGPGQYDILSFKPGQVSPGQTGGPSAYFGNMDFEPGADVAVLTHSSLDTSQRQLQVFTRFGLTGTPGGESVTSGGAVSDLISNRSGYTSEFVGSSGTVPTLNLGLNIPAGMLASDVRGFTHLEVVLFHQTAPAASVMTPLATQRRIHALNPNWPQQWVRAVPRDPSGQPITGPVGTGPPDHWPDGQHVWFTFRFVKFAASGNSSDPYLRSSRLFVAAFLLNPYLPGQNWPPSTAHLTYLSGRPGAGVPLELHEMAGIDGPNALVGFLITQETLPEVTQATMAYYYPARVVGGPALKF